MTRKSFICGNWKMNATHLDAIQMVQKLSYRLETADYERVDVVVAPPFTSLRSVQTVIEADHLAIELAAQNVHWEESGAYTGEVSPPMLAKLGVGYVIVGHSERRQMFGETDEIVNKKVKAVLAADMVPIMALGETLEEREEGVTEQRVGSQLVNGLAGLTPDQAVGVIIAYEPIWAIGTGRTAEPDDAASVIGFLRRTFGDTFGGELAEHVRIIYGGSMNPGNVAALMAKKDIDGGLVGGASLDPDQFASVVRYWV
ncbi:MAG: triose-phosphate isomerase [Acidimicrobiia bacterium]|nr:triose-phosphate isomerase [Acidimicrobiia bacterium]